MSGWPQHLSAPPDQPHPTCLTHVNYWLNCEEYDDLRRTKPGNCHMCHTPASILNIDHDHGVGIWAVRGLICDSCNQRLRHIERGARAMADDARRYLADAWHLSQDLRSKLAQRAPRVECPACGHMVALRKDGRLYTHWSRRNIDVICAASLGAGTSARKA